MILADTYWNKNAEGLRCPLTNAIEFFVFRTSWHCRSIISSRLLYSNGVINLLRFHCCVQDVSFAVLIFKMVETSRKRLSLVVRVTQRHLFLTAVRSLWKSGCRRRVTNTDGGAMSASIPMPSVWKSSTACNKSQLLGGWKVLLRRMQVSKLQYTSSWPILWQQGSESWLQLQVQALHVSYLHRCCKIGKGRRPPMQCVQEGLCSFGFDVSQEPLCV